MALTIEQIREKYPMYDALSDQQLADALYNKYYSSLDKEDFYSRIGLIVSEEPAIAEEPVQEEPEISRAADLGGRFARGATTIASGSLQAAEIQKAQERQRAAGREDVPGALGMPAFTGRGPMRIRPAEELLSRKTEEEKQQILSEAENITPESIQSGIMYRAGDALNEWVRKNIPTDKQYDEGFISQLAEGAGSLVGFVAGTMLTGPGGTAVLGAGVNSAMQFQDALDKGATVEEAVSAANVGAAVGTTEALPITAAFTRLNRATGGVFSRLVTDKIKSKAAKVGIEGLSGALEEAIQESFVEIANNFSANTLVGYDEDRAIFAGAGESAAVGGTLGFLLNTAMSALGMRRRGRAQAEADQAATAEEDIPVPPTPQEEVVAEQAEPTMPPSQWDYEGQTQADLTPGVEPEVFTEGQASPVPREFVPESSLGYQEDRQVPLAYSGAAITSAPDIQYREGGAPEPHSFGGEPKIAGRPPSQLQFGVDKRRPPRESEPDWNRAYQAVDALPEDGRVAYEEFDQRMAAIRAQEDEMWEMLPNVRGSEGQLPDDMTAVELDMWAEEALARNLTGGLDPQEAAARAEADAQGLTDRAKEWAVLFRPENIPNKNEFGYGWSVVGFNPETGTVYAQYQNSLGRNTVKWKIDEGGIEPWYQIDERTGRPTWRYPFATNLRTGQPRYAEFTKGARSSAKDGWGVNKEWKKKVDKLARSGLKYGSPDLAKDEITEVERLGNVIFSGARSLEDAVKENVRQAVRAHNLDKRTPAWKKDADKAAADAELEARNFQADVGQRLRSQTGVVKLTKNNWLTAPLEEDGTATVDTYMDKGELAKVARGSASSARAYQVLPDGSIRVMRIRPDKDMGGYVAELVGINGQEYALPKEVARKEVALSKTVRDEYAGAKGYTGVERYQDVLKKRRAAERQAEENARKAEEKIAKQEARNLKGEEGMKEYEARRSYQKEKASEKAREAKESTTRTAPKRAKTAAIKEEAEEQREMSRRGKKEYTVTTQREREALLAQAKSTARAEQYTTPLTREESEELAKYRAGVSSIKETLIARATPYFDMETTEVPVAPSLYQTSTEGPGFEETRKINKLSALGRVQQEYGDVLADVLAYSDLPVTDMFNIYQAFVNLMASGNISANVFNRFDSTGITAKNITSAYKSMESFAAELKQAVDSARREAIPRSSLKDDYDRVVKSVSEGYGVPEDVAQTMVEGSGLFTDAAVKAEVDKLSADRVVGLVRDSAGRPRAYLDRPLGRERLRAQDVKGDTEPTGAERAGMAEADQRREAAAAGQVRNVPTAAAMELRAAELRQLMALSTKEYFAQEARRRRRVRYIVARAKAAEEKGGLSPDALAKLRELERTTNRWNKKDTPKDTRPSAKQRAEQDRLLKEIEEEAALMEELLQEDRDRARVMRSDFYKEEEALAARDDALAEMERLGPEYERIEYEVPGQGTKVSFVKGRVLPRRPLKEDELLRRYPEGIPPEISGPEDFPAATPQEVKVTIEQLLENQMGMLPSDPASTRITGAGSVKYTRAERALQQQALAESGNVPSFVVNRLADFTIQNAVDLRQSGEYRDSFVEDVPQQPEPTAASIDTATEVLNLTDGDAVAQEVFATAHAARKYWAGLGWVPKLSRYMRPSRYAGLYSVADRLGLTERTRDKEMREQFMSRRVMPDAMVRSIGEIRQAINAQRRNWVLARAELKKAGVYKRFDPNFDKAITYYLQGTSVDNIRKEFGVRINEAARKHLDAWMAYRQKIGDRGDQVGAWGRESSRGAVINGDAYLHRGTKQTQKTLDRLESKHLDELAELVSLAWPVPRTPEDVMKLSGREMLNLLNDRTHNIWNRYIETAKADEAGTADSRAEAKNIIRFRHNGVNVPLGRGTQQVVSSRFLKPTKAEKKAGITKETREAQLRQIIMSALPDMAAFRRSIKEIMAEAIRAPGMGDPVRRGMGADLSIQMARSVLLSPAQVIEEARDVTLATVENSETKKLIKEFFKSNREKHNKMTPKQFLQELRRAFPAEQESIKRAQAAVSLNQKVRETINEVTDPESVMADTVSRMARTVHMSSYLQHLHNIGTLNGWLSENPEPGWEPLVPEGSALGDSTFHPPGSDRFVKGKDLYVPPEMAKFAQDMLGIDAAQHTPMLPTRVLRWSSSLTKSMKVVWNPLAHPRNMVSTRVVHWARNPFGFGAVRAKSIGAKMSSGQMFAALANKAEEFVERAKSTDVEVLEGWLTERGLTYDGGRAGAMYDINQHGFGFADENTPARHFWNIAPRRVKYIVDEAFRLEDESVKATAFLMQAAEYLELTGNSQKILDKALAKKELTADEQSALDKALDHAGEIVVNTYPTFSRTAPVIKTLSRNMVVGAFPSFSYEIVRTSAHHLRYITELGLAAKTGKMRDGTPVHKGKAALLSATKLGGLIAFWTAGSMVVQAVSDYVSELVGLDDDDEEKNTAWMARVGETPYQSKTQPLLAKYQRGSFATVSDVDLETGDYTVMAIDYVTPTGAWETQLLKTYQAVQKAMESGDENVIAVATWQALSSIADVLASEEVLFSEVKDRVFLKPGQVRTFENQRATKKVADYVQRALQAHPLDESGLAALQNGMAGLAGAAVEVGPFPEALSQAYDLYEWAAEYAALDGDLDSAQRLDMLKAGILHIGGLKQKKTEFKTEWVRQLTYDLNDFRKVNTFVKQQLLLQPSEDQEQFERLFDYLNSSRRDQFDVVFKSLQSAKQVLLRSEEEIAAALEARKVSSTAGGQALGDFYRGRYIPPGYKEMLDVAVSIRDRRDNGEEGLPSDEELEQRLRWYMESVGMEDIEVRPYE